MGVDVFWKRVAQEAISDRDASTLSELVPYWFDDQHESDVASGVLVGAEDTGALIDALLRLGATDAAGAAAAATFSNQPADWDDDQMVGTLSAADVRQVALFLADAPLEEWAERYHEELAAEARRLGYHRPFDGEWGRRVLEDARDVTELFRAAAASDEAVIVKVSA